MVAVGAQAGNQVREVPLQEGLAAGEHGMLNVGPERRLPENGGDVEMFAFRMPRGVRRVAPRAAQVAPGCAYEDTRVAGVLALTLQALEDLGDEHALSLALL